MPEFSSPACSLHQIEDAGAAHATRSELTRFLNELIEAERAGARLTLDSSRAAADARTAKLLRVIQRDEARWCAMLVRHVKALGERPSGETGAFYGKAMAITDLRKRMAFLNRGQGWVVRKLREMLPRVGDPQLRADLAEMLQSHIANIGLVENQNEADLDL